MYLRGREREEVSAAWLWPNLGDPLTRETTGAPLRTRRVRFVPRRTGTVRFKERECLERVWGGQVLLFRVVEPSRQISTEPLAIAPRGQSGEQHFGGQRFIYSVT